MIILSVDYGDTRTGIAVCDKTEFLASPVTVITEKEPEPLIEKITEIAKEKKAELISCRSARQYGRHPRRTRSAVRGFCGGSDRVFRA